MSFYGAAMFQFKLRSLFLVTLAVAVLMAVLFSPPAGAGLLVLGLVYMTLPAATLAGILYHRDAWQAFFVGMAPWSVLLAIWILIDRFYGFPRFAGVDVFELIMNRSDDTIQMWKFGLAAQLLVVFTSGFASMLIHRWATAGQRRAGDRTT